MTTGSKNFPMTLLQKRKNEGASFEPPGQPEQRSTDLTISQYSALEVGNVLSSIQRLWDFAPTLPQKPAHSSQRISPAVLGTDGGNSPDTCSVPCCHP